MTSLEIDAPGGRAPSSRPQSCWRDAQLRPAKGQTAWSGSGLPVDRVKAAPTPHPDAPRGWNHLAPLETGLLQYCRQKLKEGDCGEDDRRPPCGLSRKATARRGARVDRCDETCTLRSAPPGKRLQFVHDRANAGAESRLQMAQYPGTKREKPLALHSEHAPSTAHGPRSSPDQAPLQPYLGDERPKVTYDAWFTRNVLVFDKLRIGYDARLIEQVGARYE